MDRHVHIVCHDIPWPVTHGGHFDLYHTISKLHEEGIKIHLHCFYTERKPSDMLLKLCVEVFYYKRNFYLPFRLPYIVGSRSSRALCNRLQKDNHPILLEGIHSTFCLFQNKLQDRTVLIRLHNTEHIYYDQLAKSEKSFIKKIYYQREAKLLLRYEALIANKAILIAVSKKDQMHYVDYLDAKQVNFLPVMVPFEKVTGLEGSGTYCLYHGNLSVNENEMAVRKLVDCFFNTSGIPFIVAGHRPSKSLAAYLARFKNIQLIANPTDDALDTLIQEAHININPSLNTTGVKLKIIHSLYKGRHCITNHQAVEAMEEASLCTTFENFEDLANLIPTIMNKPFTSIDKEDREKSLPLIYDSEKNARQLITWLFPHYPTPDLPRF